MLKTKEKRDYYEVLGVERSATRDQIKQAYRQLALQYHPDRNPASDAPARFREIAEAYAVLSDDAKRREYDTTGHAGVTQQWSTEDLMRDFQFGDFFGGRVGDLSSIFGDFFGRPAAPGAAKGADLRYDLDLTLEEAALGGDRDIHITRSTKCRTCAGTGAKPGTTPTTCPQCKGRGQEQQVKLAEQMRLITMTTCRRCGGRGQWVESPCPTCTGTGYEFMPHTLKVHIPAGIDDGMVIRLAGQGEPASDGGQPGDLLVRIHLAPHPSLTRHGDHLYTKLSVTFPEAALGAKASLTGLGAEVLRLTIPGGTQGGTMLRIKGKGMPRLGGKGKGDLMAIVDVKTPTDLSARQRKLLEEFAQLDVQRTRTAGKT